MEAVTALLARLALETDPTKVGAAFTHDRSLVGLSLIVATITAFAFLELVARSRARVGVAALVWRGLSGAMLGVSLWATHFIGLIAFESPLERGLALAPAAGSALCAVICGQIALQVTGLDGDRVRYALGAAILAVGAVGMHYWGMSGLLVDGALSFRAEWALATAIGAYASCITVLLLARWLSARSHRLLAAIPLAAATAGLHYLDMAATVITPTPRFTPPETGAALPLAAVVAAGACLIAAVAIAAAVSDERRLARDEDTGDQHVVIIPTARAADSAAVVVLPR